MRKDIDGDPYYNIDEEYISDRIYYYLRNWYEQARHCVPKGIQGKEEPAEEEYGGFWYRKGLASSCGLIQFYEKHGFSVIRDVEEKNRLLRTYWCDLPADEIVWSPVI